MKALVTSLTAGVLLCVLMLSRSGLAQATWNCNSFEGCPNNQCIASDAFCPAGTAMPYEMDTSVTVWSCVPAEQGPCGDTDFIPYCTVSGYSNITLQGKCVNNICGPFARDAWQCH